jgi:YgiT-type zinc finger domain-containing protein
MSNLQKCMFCRNLTVNKKITVKKKMKDKVVTITNAPVHYCSKCSETFISANAQNAFNYVRENNLISKSIIFDFDDILTKIAK